MEQAADTLPSAAKVSSSFATLSSPVLAPSTGSGGLAGVSPAASPPQMTASTPRFFSSFSSASSGMQSAPSRQTTASTPLARSAAVCSEAVCTISLAKGVSSRGTFTQPFTASALDSAKNPICLPASFSTVFMPLDTRLRFQLVER